VRAGPPYQVHDLGAVAGLADHLDVRRPAEHQHQPGPDQGVVVDEQHADRRLGLDVGHGGQRNHTTERVIRSPQGFFASPMPDMGMAAGRRCRRAASAAPIAYLRPYRPAPAVPKPLRPRPPPPGGRPRTAPGRTAGLRGYDFNARSVSGRPFPRLAGTPSTAARTSSPPVGASRRLRRPLPGPWRLSLRRAARPP